MLRTKALCQGRSFRCRILLAHVEKRQNTQLSMELTLVIGRLNLLPLLGVILYNAVQQGDDKGLGKSSSYGCNEFSHSLTLLEDIVVPILHRIVTSMKLAMEDPIAYRSHIKVWARTATHSWHHILNVCATVRSSSLVQTRVKLLALKQIRQFGAAFGLEENVDVVSLTVPSELYDSPSSWQKAWRCSCRTCPCNLGARCHPMRVCTGCWRAVYCSTKCQTVYVSCNYPCRHQLMSLVFLAIGC